VVRWAVGSDGAVVRQCSEWYAVKSPKTERLQDGAAQSAFEKRTESGRATLSRVRGPCASAALGQHAMAHI
jgi:hypothetical protein